MRGDFDEDELDDDFNYDDSDDQDPICSDCGCDLFTENHSWDCAFVDDNDNDDDDDDFDDDGDDADFD